MRKSQVQVGILAASCALLVCLAPASAFARERSSSRKPRCARKLDPRRLPEAQALTTRGKQAFIQGHFDEAIRLFNDAHCVLPAPLFRYNVSSVYKKLNDCDNAMQFGKLYLKEAQEHDKEDARKWVSSLQHECSRVTIDSEPAGASIWIDRTTGEALGPAPWTGWVFPGKHTVVARSVGLVDETQLLDVPEGAHPPIQLKLTLDGLPPTPTGEAPAPAPSPAPVPAPAPVPPPPVLQLSAPIADAQVLIDSLQPGAVDDATLRALRGLAAHQHGSFVKATREYDAALALKPTDPDIARLRAQNLLKLVELNQTVASLEQAQALAPDRADIAEQLARLYAGMDQRDKAAAEQLRADQASDVERNATRATLKPEEIKTVAMPGLFTPMFASAPGAQDDSYIGRIMPALIGRDLARSPYVDLLPAGHAPPAGTYYAVDGQILVVPATPGMAAQLQVVARLLEAKSGAVLRSSARSGSLEEFSKIQHAAALDLLDQFVPVTAHDRQRIDLALPIEQLESLKLLSAAIDARTHGDLPKAIELLRQARASDVGNIVAVEELLAAKKALGARTRLSIGDFTPAAGSTEHVGNELESGLSARLGKLARIEVVTERGGAANAAPVPVPAVPVPAPTEAATATTNPTTGAAPPATAATAGAASPVSIPTPAPAAAPGPAPAQGVAVDTVITGTYSFMNGMLMVHVRGVDVESKAETLSEQVTSSAPGLAPIEDELAERIARGLLGSLSEEEVRLIHFEQPVAPVAVPAALTPSPTVPPPASGTAPPPATVPTPVPAPIAAAPAPVAALAPPPPVPGQPGPQPPGRGDLFQLDFRTQGLLNKLAVPPLGFDLTLISGVVSASILTVKFNWIFGTVTNHFQPLPAAPATALMLIDSGLDIELDFVWESIGFNLAAAGTIGYLQTQRSTAFFYGVRPRGGLLVQADHFQVTADVGWQLDGTVHATSGDHVANDLGGLLAQVNFAYRFDELAITMPEGFEIGYRAHFVVPEGKTAYRDYGFGFSKPGGFMLQNDLLLADGFDRVRMGAVIGIGEWPSNSPELTRFQMQEVGWDFQLSLFIHRTTFNPFIGWRIAVDRATGSGLGACGATSLGCWGAIVAPRLGVDINLVAGLNLQFAWGYDFQFSDLTVLKGKLGIGDPGNYSGYGTDVGLSYRF